MADTTMADTLTLFCLVDGQSTSHAFPVEISRTKTVGGLKDAIVSGIQAPAFRGIAAKDLTLWRVSIPEIPGDENKQIWWQGLVTTHDPALLPLELNRPRMVVSTLDNDDTTYIFIQLPAPAQGMNALHDDEPYSIMATSARQKVSIQS